MSHAVSDRLRTWPRWPGLAALLLVIVPLCLAAGGRAGDPVPAVAADDVPAAATAFVHVRVAGLLQTPLGKGLFAPFAGDGGFHRLLSGMKERTGLGPEDIEGVTLLVLPPPADLFRGDSRIDPRDVIPRAAEMWSVVLVVHTKGPYDRARLTRLAFVEGDERRWDRPPDEQLFRSVQFLGERAFALGDPASLMRYADTAGGGEAEGATGPLAKVLQAAGEQTIVVGGHVPKDYRSLAAVLARYANAPGALGTLYPLVNEPFALAIDIGKGLEIVATMYRTTPQGAAMAAEAARAGLAFLDENLDGLPSFGYGPLSREDQGGDELAADLRKALRQVQVERDGTTVRVRLTLPAESAAMKAALTGLARQAEIMAVRGQSQNNLKQIGVAMYNYHDTYAGFPPAGIPDMQDAQGKPLLSWRVALLPYLEEEELYRQFKLDEPWDSPHNKNLIGKMPKVYASPLREKQNEQGLTYYQVFVGPGTVFERVNPRGWANVRITGIQDGTSNTLLAVEGAEPVIWTRPSDLAYDVQKTVPKLGGVYPGGFNALFCDGSVRFIPDKAQERTLHLLITRNDGFPIPDDPAVFGERSPDRGYGQSTDRIPAVEKGEGPAGKIAPPPPK